MRGIYNFSLWVSTVWLKLFGGLVPKWGKLVSGRKPVFKTLKDFVDHNRKEIAWFHVASLGEYEQAKPVIHELKSKFPDWTVVLTFFSPSGYDHVIKKPQPHVDLITYLPFDTLANAQKFVGLLNPQMVFFVKYDLWANYIFTLRKRNIPLFLFSASFRSSQLYFKKYDLFFKRVLRTFDHIFVQNQPSLDLLSKINYDKATVTGDTRYDNVKSLSQNPKSFPEIKDFVEDKPVIVIGSAWEEDMELIVPFINAGKAYKFIVAPHDIDNRMIKNWQDRINIPSFKYSEWEHTAILKQKVLFIDNIGMLSSLYQYATIAYVGGALRKGLHNILEPLAFGIPVVFGKLKNPNKFPEAQISVSYGCGFEVAKAEEFKEVIHNLEEEQNYQRACKAAERLVDDNLGSAKKIIAHVQKMIQGI